MSDVKQDSDCSSKSTDHTGSTVMPREILIDQDISTARKTCKDTSKTLAILSIFLILALFVSSWIVYKLSITTALDSSSAIVKQLQPKFKILSCYEQQLEDITKILQMIDSEKLIKQENISEVGIILKGF